MSLVKKAFYCYKKGELQEALRLYEEATKLNPCLKKSLSYNIKRITEEISNLPPPAKNNEAHPQQEMTIAVVFHVYHEDVVEEILNRLSLIKNNFDLFITTPLNIENSAIKNIIAQYPNSKYFYSINKGRDVLPFMNVYSHIKEYELCLKIHTKKGLTNYGDMWRAESLECLLPSPNKIKEIIGEFENDATLAIAGPKTFYSSGRRLMYGNQDGVSKLCDLMGFTYEHSREWGFFAGTMFWFRPTTFIKLYEIINKVSFGKEEGKQDGEIEHAVERIFGLIPSYDQSKALLLESRNKNFLLEKINMPGSPGGDDPTKNLLTLAKAKLKLFRIAGDVNKQSEGALADMKVRGWIAKLDAPEPRTFVLRIGNTEIEGVAVLYRGDLKDVGINDGCHAFEVKIPLKYANGKQIDIALFDKDTGLPVAINKYKLKAITRSYADFNSYLSHSYTNPYIQAPFVEEDKRAFSTMEVISNYLAGVSKSTESKPLFTIIMPTFNRAKTIMSAINSVIDQTYHNWELLIIDDGSHDDTESLISEITDERVRFFKNKTNRGVSFARNYGLKLAQGEFIAYLDTDNAWDIKYLSVIHGATIEIGKEASAFYTGQMVFRGGEKEIEGVRFGMFNRSLLFNNNYIDLNCFVHKKNIIELTGEFDECIKRFVDWDFIARISLSTKIYSIPVLLCNYHLESVDNTITGNSNYFNFYDQVRTKLSKSLLEHIRSKKPKPKFNERGVSVIIPSYNAKTDLEVCLSSLETYFDRKSFEVIVVDNFSSKDTLDYLDDYAKKHPAILKIIKLTKNYGFTYAANIGIENSVKTNDVMLLNNDAVLIGYAIDELQSVLHSSENFGVAVPAQILPANTETISVHVPYANPDGDVDVNVSAHHRNLTKPIVFYGGEPFEVDFAPFFCALIKRETLTKVGNLDLINGRHYRSDRTYCSSIKAIGNLAVIFCPEAIFYHKLQRSTKELNFSKTKKTDFNLIFHANTWDFDEQSELGFNLPVWNKNY